MAQLRQAIGILPAGALGVSLFYHLTRELREGGPNRPFVLKNPPPGAVAADERGTVLLDLARLPPAD